MILLLVKQIMRIKMSPESEAEVEEIYSNDGTEISGASSVVVYEHRRTRALLIGTALRDAYYCELKTGN